MAKLYIPNSVALRNFDAVFRNNDFDFADRKVMITFHPRYVAMHPVGLALYAAIADRLARDGIKSEVSIDNKIKSIPYLQRMGLFSALGYVNPIKTKEHEETGRFIPLMKIRTSDELGDFIRTVDPILHTTRENSRVIKHVFSELLRNVLEHSDAPFTGKPLKLAAGHFGLGHGSGAHAPDGYYIIESTNPKIRDFDGATMSFVEYLYELAK